MSDRSGNNKKLIAVCDSDLSYAGRLVEYLRQEAAFPFEIRLYTSTETLLEDCDTREADLVVIAQSQYTPAAAQAGLKNLLMLNESDVLLEEPENISKFQSIANIVTHIRAKCAAEEEPVLPSLRHGRPMVRIGVYTPVTRCLQTTFSMTLGQILASRHRVLYMNFEAFSGLDKMLARNFRGSVSDLIYYNECAREKLAGQLEMMTEEAGGMHFLPPMKSFIELRSIKREQWSSLLRVSHHGSDRAYGRSPGYPAYLRQGVHDRAGRYLFPRALFSVRGPPAQDELRGYPDADPILEASRIPRDPRRN